MYFHIIYMLLLFLVNVLFIIALQFTKIDQSIRGGMLKLKRKQIQNFCVIELANMYSQQTQR